MKKIYFLVICLFISANVKVNAQKKSTKVSDEYFSAVKWRNIGPFRGGRSAAVTGVSGKANLFYMGSTGGGVWKTTDAGNTWQNISDGFFGGSVGAIAVSESDNNVMYAGMGEKTVRGNVSSGDGIWKTENAGKTWKHVGLKNSRHIPRMRIHPKNADIVFAGVMGDLYKPTQERGVYKSADGGENWKRVLFSDENSGVVDLIIDPNNARILYATTWDVRRTPYSLSSGGKGSALWKSVDQGETWTNISTNKGLPSGIWGIAGVTVSPINSDIVWALIENEKGGIYKSTDAGKTFKLINSERKLRQRAWYYTRIYADTQDENILYVLNVRYHKSTDGGKTYKTYNAPHGDHHDLWIAPEDNQRMIIGDDGGAQISFDAGDNWSTYMNQPTSQFYRVTTDNYFPYRILAAQQDNSTVRISHRTSGRFITESDWTSTAGGESAHIAVDPLNDDIVYGGSYGGLLTRKNHKTNETRAINVWPDDPMGHGAEDFKYRFQWNFPIFFSPNNEKKLYAASNHLHVTENEGQSWKIISPDLTRNDPKTLKSSGGPITQDNTGVEYYGTIFAATESTFEPGLIWTGSDDGLVHISKNNGETWNNVTPKKMPEWMMINCIEIDPFTKGGAYIVGTKYKSGDYKPYIYKTENYGKSWKLIVEGISDEDFTRALRADPKRKGLLYAGTERGMYISFDDGKNWQSFKQNLPIVPITDLTIKDDNLIAATQGRSLWIIDDLTPLHQLNESTLKKEIVLYKPKNAYNLSGGNGRTSRTAGTNHSGGVSVNYYIKKVAEKDVVSISFFDSNDHLIKKYTTKPDKEKKEEKLKVADGNNIFNWNMMHSGAESVKGMILWWASLSGPMALPGNYKVELAVNETKQTQRFNIIRNPASEATERDMKTQFDFINEINTKMTEIHKALKNVQKVRGQVGLLKKSIKDKETHKALLEYADTLVKDMTTIEETLYQTKSKSGQDPLNFPIRLNNKLAHLNSLTRIGNYAPTQQAFDFKNDIVKDIDIELKKLYSLFDARLKELNQKVKESNIDLIQLD
ncbi:sortilin (neurotensin receptor 3) [Polaribacter sp. Hel1_33_96]|uniref:WD40/YVTN/BNR-like repeat-containing protein n=1 Tax=Polaribacter sp. Hel1_33_96 TaxID=1336805 RepID=UPI000C7063CE|nr:glycosyl hydrolase [Polaribacter sp. Hel1_33_96]PKV65741.1 sortilin (neurotensin receptor 3) [Polaribacter sp. Hel1_33_96]